MSSPAYPSPPPALPPYDPTTATPAASQSTTTTGNTNEIDRRALFGRKASRSQTDATASSTTTASSAVVAGSLRPVEPIQLNPYPPAINPLQPSSSTVAANIVQNDPSTIQRAQQERELSALAAEQQRIRDQNVQERLAQLDQQQRADQDQAIRQMQLQQAATLSPLTIASPSGSPASPSVASPIGSNPPMRSSDPDGVDHSVDPSAPPPTDSSISSHYSWLRLSSLQQSPVTVYYSKDPISNLQVRVILRRQPEEASASSQPKTLKQLNLAMKEKQKKEEKERELGQTTKSEVAGHTSPGALHGQGPVDDDANSGTLRGVNDPPTEPKRDAQGRVILSPSMETEYKPAVLAIQLFSWQQKVCSPTEIMLAAINSKSSSSYIDQVKHLLKDRYPTDDFEVSARKYISSQRDGMMLHSKRDHDRYIDPDDLHKHITTSKNLELNPLAERMVKAPLVSKRSENHITREMDSIPYHILATVDLPNDPSKVTLMNRDASEIDAHPPGIVGAFQKPLVSFKVIEGDEYVTLEMRPAFSPPQKNVTEFDDAEWYSFYTPAGEHFRYRVENYSAVIDEPESSSGATSGLSKTMITLEQRAVEAEIARMAAHDMQVAKHRSGREFDQGPLLGFETMHILGEIIKTSGFVDDELSCSYEVDLRNNIHTIGAEDVWTAAPGNRLEAVTQSSCGIFTEPTIAGKPPVRECYFSFPFEWKLSKQSKMPALTPVLYLQVQSVNAWGIACIVGYGFVHLPLTPGCHELTIDTWVPLGSLSDQKTKFFIGAGPTLRDVKLCGVPNDKSVLNRYGWQCSANGKIHLRLEVVHLRPAATPSNTQQTSLALDSLRAQFVRGDFGSSSMRSPTSSQRKKGEEDLRRSTLLQRSQSVRDRRI